ncbi:MAG: NirA family protein [Acidobacteriota bacterium]|nr:NirA family protein [Acidobacteriota bacterium]
MSDYSNSTTAFAESGFTAEQQQYLQGFFAGVQQRGIVPFVGHTSSGLMTHDAASGLVNQAAQPVQPDEELLYGTPVSELCREERWKLEENPLDIWDKLLAHASADTFPATDDAFRFKFHGLFHVAPAQDSFMLRLRIPGGVLRSYQLRGLAEMATQWGCGRADLTTRANLQLRELRPRDLVNVLHKVQALGLSSRGSGADNIRNITASPLTGLDPAELYDVAPLAEAMSNYILNSRDLYGLPRKFNIAFDNGGAISVLADTNDIGFAAVRVTEGQGLAAGIYFRVLLSGITGHRQFASDAGLLLEPREVVAVAAAMIRVFTQNGDRTNRKKARLKYLIDRWGVAKFLAETEQRLAFPLRHAPLSVCEPRGAVDRSAHIGAYAQKQAGMVYLGVAVPVGQLPAAQMQALAEIAERYGTGELRLTVWQNLIVPNIPADRLKAARAALQSAGLSDTAGTVLRGTVACTGNQGCKYASADTKTHAVTLARYIDDRFPMLEPVNLHVTGCAHSCAQHYVGDVGLIATRVDGEEGYHVVVGGGSDQDQGLARELLHSVKFNDLFAPLSGLFRAYTRLAPPGESLLQFTRRHTLPELQALCNHQEQ